MPLKKIFESFRNAFNGMVYLIKTERNFRIELILAFFVLVLAIFLKIDDWKLVTLIAVSFLVILLEALNTLVERMVNIFKPRIHPYARVIKDVMASIVLISSIGALAIGLIIFIPYIFNCR